MSAASSNEDLIIESTQSVNEQGLFVEIQESISLLTVDICEIT